MEIEELRALLGHQLNPDNFALPKNDIGARRSVRKRTLEAPIA
jgi:hypothetical protein